MKNWTIGKRIITGGAILIVLLLLVGGVAVSSLTRLEKFAATDMRDDTIPGMVNAAQITSQSLRGYVRLLMAGSATDAASRDEHIKFSDANVASTLKAMDDYEAAITSPEDRRNFDELLLERAVFATTRSAFLELLKAGKTEEARLFQTTQMQPAYFAYRDQIGKLLTWNQDIGMATVNAMVTIAHRAAVTAAVIAGVSILLSSVLGWFIIRGTNRALRQIAATLNDASAQVSSASREVSTSGQSLAEGASEQAASLEETSASLEEISSMTRRNAESAENARAISNETSQATEVSTRQMGEMVEAMSAIKSSSDNIAKIIKTIDEISFQTNILALNAAVEAARAGEAGAGFAVVADEVRALAQRAAQAARETAEKIDDSIAKSSQGVEISAKVAEGLSQITAKTRQVNDLVVEIATASKEQSQGLGQIGTAISQMDQVTQTNAANAEETAAASEELSAQAAALLGTVGELLQLVGGTARADSDLHAAPPAHESPSHKHQGAAARGAQTLRPGAPRKLIAPSLHKKEFSLAHANGSGHDDNFFKNV